MNPEGRKTPNPGESIDKRVRQSIEERDSTRGSQGTNSKAKQITPNSSQTELQKKLALLKLKPQQNEPSQQKLNSSNQKINELKQKHPHLFPQNPNSSASSSPSPS